MSKDVQKTENRNGWTSATMKSGRIPNICHYILKNYNAKLFDGLRLEYRRTSPLPARLRYARNPHLQLWYKKPPTRNHAYHRFLYIGSRWRIAPLDIGGFMGIVPRQESVPNSSMRHRELLKWHC
jgi:hypothetical protein